jgi:hypothetical protein
LNAVTTGYEFEKPNHGTGTINIFLEMTNQTNQHKKKKKKKNQCHFGILIPSACTTKIACTSKTLKNNK